jgi:acetyl-CoA carboxylase biotin carboxylase subunit
MFKRLLIANRGEIAVRIIRACRDLDIETVAVYSEADENALHVRLADEAICIGPPDALHSYLDMDAVLKAARSARVDAIHPGYGFLSENADFAERVTKAGYVWVGPSAETIRQVGNKDDARKAMLAADLPMAKGSEPIASNEEAYAVAEDVGYPVILKPVSGGGGKSMFVAHDKDELAKILQLVDVTKVKFYFEHYIAQSRHIEVQIMADNYGNIVHLGERECSIQRRNQKILEEAPSPALTEEMREHVGKLAVRAAKCVHYTNIGTVEFLMDVRTGEFFFMEINPRIQVEHGITEAVTGIDIVRRQIRIAAGEPLYYKQRDIKITGHAIECRINAEDPDNNFLPSPGEITYYHEPGGPGVRIDSGITASSCVQPYYDSLIAKIITHGRVRGEAIKMMKRALRELDVEGVKTTRELHKSILEDTCFCTGNIDTQFIKKRLPVYEQTRTETSKALGLNEKLHQFLA